MLALRFTVILSLMFVLFTSCEAEPEVGNGSGDADGDSDSDADQETDTCANLDLTLDRQPAAIMLVIDASATMNLQLGDNDTRWSVIHKALMGTVSDPEAGLVWALEDQVNFGMVLFTAIRTAEGEPPEECPLLSTVAPALNNGAEIADIFLADNLDYMGASPVPEGIDAAASILLAMDKPGKKVILLATDGLPQTCDTLADSPDPVGQAAAVAAVQDAYTQGISTFVVGVGNEITAAHLQQVANAGVGLAPTGTENALYYQSETENSLIQALSGIVTEESRTCVYELDGKGVAEGEEGKGRVLLDGVELELGNQANGWQLKSQSEIELLGTACETIQFGEHRLEADFPCEAIVIIV